jgi:hypothetical protein
MYFGLEQWFSMKALLTTYSARGQLMCHEDASPVGSTWAFDAPAQIL